MIQETAQPMAIAQRNINGEHHLHGDLTNLFDLAAYFYQREIIIKIELLYFYDNYYNGVGFLRSSAYAKLVKCSTDTALRDLQDLVSKEMLKIENKGKKTNYIIVSPKGIRIPKISES